MKSITRKVSDIQSDERRVYEEALGHKLQENQQIIIRVVNIGVEPAAADRDRALADMQQLSKRGREHREARDVSEDEADQALDEAIRTPKKL